MISFLKRSLWIFDVGFRLTDEEFSPGWAAHMGIFCILPMMMIAGFGLGLDMAWPLAFIGSLDLLVTLHFTRRALRRIGRLGLFGPGRALWWIEVAALDWTFCMSSGIFSVIHSDQAAALPAWQQSIVTLAGDCAKLLFFSFFVLTTYAYILGLIQGKRIRGPSLELVNWFFWVIVLLSASYLIPEFILVSWIAPAFAVLGGIAICIAVALEIRKKLQERAARL